MRKPVIGITPSFDTKEERYVLFYNYAGKIAMCGGTPVILPVGFDDISILDGIMFSGGGDLRPELGGYEDSDILDSVILERDAFESQLFLKANEAELPILGICRGHQLINCMLGGTLHRDIHEAGFQEAHRLGEGKGYHPVVTEEGTLARALLGEEAGVWSTHHQAVKELGKGLSVTARSKEGVVEAIEHENGRILGLQTHPERMEITAPFEWLVRKSAQYHKTRR